MNIMMINLKIDLTNSFNNQREKIKKELITYIKSKFSYANIEIEEITDDAEITDLFDVIYEKVQYETDDDIQFDSIRFYLGNVFKDLTNMTYTVHHTYTEFINITHKNTIDNLDELYSLISNLIDNVNGNNIRKIDLSMFDNYDEFHPTKDLTKKDLDLN